MKRSPGVLAKNGWKKKSQMRTIWSRINFGINSEIMLRLKLLFLLLCISSVVFANTEVVAISAPENYTSVHKPLEKKDILRYDTKKKLRRFNKVSIKDSQKLAVDFLKVTERKSVAIFNSRHLTPVSVIVELVDLEPGREYNLKACWSALSPVDLELSQVVLPQIEQQDGSVVERVGLNITLKPDFYSTKSTKELDHYLNDIVIEISCIDFKLLSSMVSWIIISTIVGFKSAQHFIKSIT